MSWVVYAKILNFGFSKCNLIMNICISPSLHWELNGLCLDRCSRYATNIVKLEIDKNAYIVMLLVKLLSEIHPCENKPCRNGGACNYVGKSYSCSCVGGFTGTDCDAGDV